jgi:hypothetical protein
MLAILGIVIPLGLAYAILFQQSRQLDYGYPKVPATTRVEQRQEEVELSSAEKKQVVRLMKHWLL